MESTTDDDLRLIYVAMTRAQKLLVIACKEKISEESKLILNEHNVLFLE
jgi:ATP-dependent exoDNAse (exonuclease V) beta subunit